MRNIIGGIKFKDVHVVDMIDSQVPYYHSTSCKDERKHEEEPKSWYRRQKLIVCPSQLLL